MTKPGEITLSISRKPTNNVLYFPIHMAKSGDALSLSREVCIIHHEGALATFTRSQCGVYVWWRITLCILGEQERGSHPDANSPLDSLRGLPPSMVMMVAMSSSAASTRSYHLHACTPANVL